MTRRRCEQIPGAVGINYAQLLMTLCFSLLTTKDYMTRLRLSVRCIPFLEVTPTHTKLEGVLQAAEKLVSGERTVYFLGCSDSGDTSSCASLVASARFSAACLSLEDLANLRFTVACYFKELLSGFDRFLF
jgi:hypothetical protein